MASDDYNEREIISKQGGDRGYEQLRKNGEEGGGGRFNKQGEDGDAGGFAPYEYP